MDVLADENVESEWVNALRNDGYDVERDVDVGELGAGTPDPDVLVVARRIERTLLTADQSDLATHRRTTTPASSSSQP